MEAGQPPAMDEGPAQRSVRAAVTAALLLHTRALGALGAGHPDTFMQLAPGGPTGALMDMPTPGLSTRVGSS